MSTNGLWTDEQRAFVLDHFNEVSLSFDGAEAVQNRQRPRADGGATYAAVRATLRALDERRLPYGLRMTVTDGFVEDLAEGVEQLCRETTCPTFQIEPAFGHGRAERDGFTLHEIERFSPPCSRPTTSRGHTGATSTTPARAPGR